MKHWKEVAFITLLPVAAIAMMGSLIYLLYHQLPIAIMLWFITPLVALTIRRIKPIKRQVGLKSYSLVINSICLIAAFTLSVSRTNCCHLIGPLFMDNYEITWHAGNETGNKLKSGEFAGQHINDNAASAVMLIFWWLLTFGSPVLTYVQTKKLYDVLRPGEERQKIRAES